MRDIAISILAALFQGVANFLAMIVAFIILAFVVAICSVIGQRFRGRSS